MGNVNGRDEIEDDSSADVRSTRSGDSVEECPPENPGRRSRTPLVFAPQIPVPPLQSSYNLSNEHHLWMNEPDQPSEGYFEKGIPTLFTWNYGGNVVLVEGSWDNWASRKN